MVAAWVGRVVAWRSLVVAPTRAEQVPGRAEAGLAHNEIAMPLVSPVAKRPAAPRQVRNCKATFHFQAQVADAMEGQVRCGGLSV